MPKAMAVISKEAGVRLPSAATLKNIWLRTPDMKDGNDVKIPATCGMHVSDVRSFAKEKLPFPNKEVKEGELEVVTLAGHKLDTKMRVSDLTEDTRCTLIVRIAAKELAPPPEPLQEWAPATPAAVELATPAPTAPPRSPRRFADADTSPPPSPTATAVSYGTTLAPLDRVGSFGTTLTSFRRVPPDVVPKPATFDFVVHLDRIAPDLPDACLRQAVEERMGRTVVELEVVRSGVSDAARSQHFAFVYAFAFLSGLPPPAYHALSHSPEMIDVSHSDVLGPVTRLGAGKPVDFERGERVRMQATNKTRSMPEPPEPRATLHIRVFARISREEGSGWSERLESIKWPGFLALLEAACERAPPGAMDHIKIIADDKGGKNARTHPHVLLCRFFVQCHSVEGAKTLMGAANDQRVCCDGVAFLLQCDYTQKEKKLYDRCGPRDTYKTFYAQQEQKYEDARTKAKVAVKAGSLGRMLGEAQKGDLFTFGDRRSYSAGAPSEPLPERRQFPAITGASRAQPGPSPAGMSGGPTGSTVPIMATAGQWDKHVDLHSGREYWHCRATGETAWEPPAVRAAGWKQHHDLDSGEPYWEDASGTITWNPPQQWAYYMYVLQQPMQQSLAQPAYQPVLAPPAYHIQQQLPMQQSQQPMQQQLQPQPQQLPQQAEWYQQQPQYHQTQNAPQLRQPPPPQYMCAAQQMPAAQTEQQHTAAPHQWQQYHGSG